MGIKRFLRRIINSLDNLLGLRELIREDNNGGHPLEGDRAIEWSWVVANLPKHPCRILDLGCVQSALTGIASRLGHEVTAVDMRDIEYQMERVTFLQGDFNELDLGNKRFDIIINCSTLEHIGLGGRYGSSEKADGDVLAMGRLRSLLAPSGAMILTIPVGQDAVFRPFHRIYGEIRLPILLENYLIQEEEYWSKDKDRLWKRCSRAKALEVAGSEKFYALGLFVLKRPGEDKMAGE